MLTYFLFAIGFVFLIKGADYLVDGASVLARRLKISDLVIGLTVVAFGTSAPELVVNLYAGFQEDSGIAIGNILGSNIANIFLILGISAIINTLTVTSETVWKQIPLTLLAAVILCFLVNDNLIFHDGSSMLGRWDGMVLLALFAVFIFFVVKGAIAQRKENKEKETVSRSLKKTLFLVIIGLITLNLGAKWVVDGATNLAEALGASDILIGLTIVAIGTSLPELVTSVIAAYHKNADIAVGNIVGSNIFNIFFILGISSITKPISFQSTANIDLGINVMASLLLFAVMFTGKRRNLLEKREGIAFVAIYTGYIIYSALRG